MLAPNENKLAVGFVLSDCAAEVPGPDSLEFVSMVGVLVVTGTGDLNANSGVELAGVDVLVVELDDAGASSFLVNDPNDGMAGNDGAEAAVEAAVVTEGLGAPNEKAGMEAGFEGAVVVCELGVGG